MNSNKSLNILILVSIIGLIFSILSCEESADRDDLAETELSKTTPIDGAVGIALDATIDVTFTEGMDRNSCQSRFGLYMGELDSIPTNMMGQMHGMLPGQFHWNGDTTLMTFLPDSMFMDSTMYSICLQEGMQMHHHGQDGMMGEHMGNHGISTQDGVIVRFMTGN